MASTELPLKQALMVGMCLAYLPPPTQPNERALVFILRISFSGHNSLKELWGEALKSNQPKKPQKQAKCVVDTR